MQDNVWFNAVPLIERVFDNDEFGRYARDFIDSLERDWLIPHNQVNSLPVVPLPDDLSYPPTRADAIKWNTRVQQSINEADVYRTPGAKYVCRMAGYIVALMIITRDDGQLKINDLTTHPGLSGGGQAMIEFAVNLGEGYVKLFDATEDRGFYHHLGFSKVVGQNDRNMYLNAEQSQHWQILGGKWRFIRYS